MTWPTRYDGSKAIGYGMDGSNSYPLNVPTANASHTKGAWTELVAATEFETDCVWVILGAQTNAVHYLVDIGIGAAGSEQVLIPNLHSATNSSNLTYHKVFQFPISIPAGTRIAARSQSESSSTANIRVGLLLTNGGFMQSYGGVEAVGPDTATSAPPRVNPNDIAEFKGDWVVLTAGTLHACRALLITAQRTVAYTGFGVARRFRLDIGFGIESSEQILIPDLAFGIQHVAGTTGALNWYVTPPLPIALPAGTRIVGRIASSYELSLGADVAAYLLY